MKVKPQRELIKNNYRSRPRRKRMSKKKKNLRRINNSNTKKHFAN
jgi:hypothetical protein